MKNVQQSEQTELNFYRKRQKNLAGVRQHGVWKIEGQFNCSKCMENSKCMVDILNYEEQFFMKNMLFLTLRCWQHRQKAGAVLSLLLHVFALYALHSQKRSVHCVCTVLLFRVYKDDVFS
jgi:hypothetical protein